jgi:pyruvate/2-oxoglutarate dehydrogenase complex dihydrolipoamide dehydrogenase (E3) component
MTQPTVFDYLVIGAGSGGLLVAVGLQKMGKNVAVISKNIGGDCTHYGCVPSKTLLHLAKQYIAASTSTKKLELKKNALQKVQEVVASFTTEEEMLISSDSYFKGAARFIDARTVEVTDAEKNKTSIQFRKRCIIATGSRPASAPIPGVPSEKLITNEEFFYLKELPRSITIIGGGPIGAELATVCASFGVETYLVAREYLSKEPKEVATRSMTALQKLGVQYRAVRADKLEGRSLLLEDGSSIPETDYYLMAVGRKPNTQLELENAGVLYTEKGIAIDDNLQTSNADIFAIGDCTESPQFTHLAANHGKFVLKKLLVPFARKRNRALPRVTFTAPAIASVGNLEESNHNKIFVLNFAATDRARTNFDETSYGQVLVDIRTGQIQGVSLFGDFSEELITVFTLIIDERIPVLQLTDFITPYPTHGNILHTLSVEYLTYLSKSWKKYPVQSFYQFLTYILN